MGLIFGYVAGAVVSLLAGMALAIPFFILDALKDILIATYEAFSS